MPVSSLQPNRRYNISVGLLGVKEDSSAAFLRIDLSLAMRRLLDHCVDLFGCHTIYVGLLSDKFQTASGVIGQTLSIPGSVAAASTDFGYALNVSHELGHALNQYHVFCLGTERGVNTNYPFPGGLISGPSSAETYYGFDFRSAERKPSNSSDLMSYCHDRQWISKYTYESILDYLKTQLAVRPPDVHASDDGRSFFVGGIVSPPNQGSIELIYVADTTGAAGQPGTIIATIEVRDKNRAIIAVVPVAGLVGSEGGSSMAFVAAVPYSSAATSIDLVIGGRILASRAIAPTPPSVRFVAPGSGDVITGSSAKVKWAGTVAGGRTATYTVQYSVDNGSTWTTIAADVASEETSWDLKFVPSGRLIQLRVLMTDGFETAADHLTGIIVIGEAVSPIITTSRSSYSLAETIVLNATSDNDASLIWRSDRMGVLGTGSSIAVPPFTLPLGKNVVSVTAANGLAATKEITVASSADGKRRAVDH
jgi:hypothetical protein